MKLKILVTGGAGFIGSNFVHYLLSQKIENLRIQILDKLTYAGSMENLDGLPSGAFEFIKGDICDTGLVLELVKQNDVVVHFAAESHVDNSISAPENFIQTNIVGTQSLLDACLQKPSVKFVYISTDEVYGSRTTGSFVETDKLNPSSPYSASKAAGELLVQAYGKTFGLKYNITRCSNNYGPRQHNEKLIPHFIELLKNNKKLTIYGNGKNIRDWIFVDDHCAAILKVINHAKSREIYNIGGNFEVSNLEISKLLLERFNLSNEFLDYVQDRPGHDFRYAISSNKISQDLGFTPQISFENGFKKTLDWYTA